MDQKINRIQYFFLLIIFLFSLVTFLAPVLSGLISTVLTSLGFYFDLSYDFSLEFYKKTLLLPGIGKSIFLSFFVGIVSTLLSLFLSQVILSKLYYTKYLATLKKILFPLIAFPHLTMAIGISFLFSSSGYLIRLVSLVYDFERPPNTNLFPDDFGLFLILGLILKEIPFFS